MEPLKGKRPIGKTMGTKKSTLACTILFHERVYMHLFRTDYLDESEAHY